MASVDPLASLAQLASVDPRARMASMARRERLDVVVFLGKLACLAAKVPVAARAPLELACQDLLAVPALVGSLEFRDLQDAGAPRVLMASQARTARKGRMASLDVMVSMERPDQPVSRGLMGRKGQRATAAKVSCRFTSTHSKAMWI